ncbi:DAK2 domain-containing protein, partial [Corynebacterium variabile]
MTVRTPDTLTGDYLDAWATASLAGLRRHRAEINRLNVFPIPDSDTGTNMAATMESAVTRLREVQGEAQGEAQGETGAHAAVEVAAALAAGAVAGARGNSGMVLSQILRAVADTAALSATGELSARTVPVMLARAGELVLDALSDPVEGT